MGDLVEKVKVVGIVVEQGLRGHVGRVGRFRDLLLHGWQRGKGGGGGGGGVLVVVAVVSFVGRERGQNGGVGAGGLGEWTGSVVVHFSMVGSSLILAAVVSV